MSDTVGKLRQELQAAQRALAEAKARCERHDAEHQAAAKELEDNRSALLFMLEDLESARRKIGQAHQEWMAALDVVNDPIFLHDKNFRILRCNLAYQRCAGVPFHEIIGHHYYEIFPKADAPLPCCLRVTENAEEEEEEVAVGNAIYRSRAFSIHDEQGAYLYSVHILECITEHKRAERELSESETRFRNLVEATSDWIWEIDENNVYTYASPKIHDILGYEAAEIVGKTPFDLMPHEEAKRVADIFGTIAAARISFSNLENTNLHKDGHPVVLETSGVPVFDAEGKFRGYRGVDRDITGRKQAEVVLVESEEKLRKIAESAQDAIIMMGTDQNISFWNAAAERIFGYTAAEAMGHELHALITPARARARFAQAFPHFQATGEGPLIGKMTEVSALRKGGGEFPVELSISAARLNGQWHAISTLRDITVRKQAEEELRLRAQLLDSVSDTIFLLDLDGNFVYLNEAAWKSRGYTRDEMMGIDLHALDTPKFEKLIGTRFKEIMEKGQSFFESEHRRKDGTVMPVEINARTIELGGRKLVLSIIRDITERKRMDEELQLAYFALNHAVDSVFFMEPSGKFLYVNETACRALGYSKEELLSMGVADIDPNLPDGVPLEMSQATKEAGIGRVESKHKTKDGRLIPVEVIVAYLQYKGGDYHCSFVRDITERKQAETAIQHASRALATLSAANKSLVHSTSEDELLRAICQAIVKQRGYRLAWVGYVQHDENKSIKIMACAGHDEGYLDAIQLTWAETGRGMGPSGRAVLSGATQLCQNIATDPICESWRDEAIKRGFAANIALPLMDGNGEVFGILHVYAEEVDAFTPAEIALLEEMAGDLAFGVRALHIRRERDLALEQNQRHFERLQDSLEDTVRAIASIIEMRDSYTAGHQVRVADLAMAIAKQMGLSGEQIHGVHLAGVVHDLGKIKIPAEILSKPGRITDIEYSLIKIHSQAGYDILKGINFPWPIAQMVLQHHERLDGSGYPQGLQGDAILLEARILSVADVVEAMYSHRPYRPGLGLEAALAEITRQRGIYLDTQVVDACQALFREQQYSFK